MRLLIAGSSGFLGSQLGASLETAGHFVVRLVRGTPTAADQIRWRPYDEPLDPDVLDDVDVVVNLAGSALVGNPHSSRWANELLRSRVETTRTLAEAIAKAPKQPVFLAGNATGYYGDHGDEVLTDPRSAAATRCSPASPPPGRTPPSPPSTPAAGSW